MNFLRFLFSKAFLKQLLILAGVFIVLLIIINFWLKSFTNHGEYITVPDFSGLLYSEVEDYADERDLEAVIIDSIYDNTKTKGSVISQDPLPGALVKDGRKIYLTIVSLSPEMVKMPNLIDITLRQAISTLETYGLRVGKLTYVPHIAVNAVLKQEYRGVKIPPGKIIEKGSRINLTLGQGLRDEKIQVPFLLGMSREDAIIALHSASLNVGAEVYEEGASAAKAFVSKQAPLYSENTYVNLGTSIDLWYKPKADTDLKMLQNQLQQENASQTPQE